MLAAPGMTSADLDLWGMEERVLQVYHGGSGVDAWTLKIREFWAVEDPTQTVVRQHRLARDRAAR